MLGQFRTQRPRPKVFGLAIGGTLAMLVLAAAARAEPAVQAASRNPALFPGASLLRSALAAVKVDTIVVRMAPPPENHVLVAQRVPATPERVRTHLLDPESYRRAVPSLVEATLLRADHAGKAREVAWELEVPGFNPKGRLWLKDFGEVIQLRLSQGAFSPGEFLWRVVPDEDHTLLVLQATANVRDVSWVTRRLVEREQLAEPAITVTAALVLVRAMALLAAPGVTQALRTPVVPMEPPVPSQLETSALFTVARAFYDEQATATTQMPIGLVHTAPGGRLSYAQVGMTVALPPRELSDALATASNWTALPGWRRVTPSAATGSSGTTPARDGALAAGARQSWAVTSSFPFVSFDGVWEVTRGRSLRAVNQSGHAKGALWSWEVQTLQLPATSAKNTFAVLSLYPRLDRIGYLPRKFIEKEPLLEHALSLALAYVDAVTLLRRIATLELSSLPRMQERQAMVSSQIAARGVRDPDVLRALLLVPRHLFVPEDAEHAAYQDRPLSIGHAQTISQPYIVGLMTELSGARRGSRVLEIGTGSGYQAAVLSALGAEVYSIEIIEPLATFARERLARLDLPGAGAIHLRVGDGYTGWPEAAPFDAIVVTAAPSHIPEPLKTQLKIGGKLVIPVGPDGEQQALQVVTRTPDGYKSENILPVRFVPMTGKAQQ